MNASTIASHGGGLLHCGQWLPNGHPKAILQIVHGISEHIARYDEFARFLTDNGILVVAEDHMGHGKSVDEDHKVGHFYGGWEVAVDDVESLRQKTAAEYPNVPYFILGHSMGSFMARTLLFRHGGKGLSGVILSGTGWTPKAIIASGLALCKRKQGKYTELGRSEILQWMMIGRLNLKFAPSRTAYDWVSTDEDVVDAYINDPNCGAAPTIGLIHSLLTGLAMNQNMENLRAMPKKLPIFLFSGKKVEDLDSLYDK